MISNKLLIILIKNIRYITIFDPLLLFLTLINDNNFYLVILLIIKII